MRKWFTSRENGLSRKDRLGNWWYNSKFGTFLRICKNVLKRWAERKVTAYYRRRDEKHSEENVREVIQRLHAWYKEDPKRWMTGQWHSIQYNTVAEEVEDGNVGKYDTLYDRQQFASKKYWSELHQAQETDVLRACLMGGFEKFAWHVLGEPNMGRIWNSIRVSGLATDAGFEMLKAVSPMWVQNREREGALNRGRIVNLVTEKNDHGSYSVVLDYLKRAQ